MRYCLSSIFLFAVTLSGYSADWPQFLGANRDSTTKEVIPVWKETPKTLWKKPLGPSHSSPVVANGVVYAFYQAARTDKTTKIDKDVLAAFDLTTGELKWEKSYERPRYDPPFGEGPRGTPSIDGDSIYTLGGTGILASWNAKNGNINWQVDTLKEFKAKNLTFGVSTSPTIVWKNVVIMVGGKDAGIVAFDKVTGKSAWQSTNDTASYASPIVMGEGDKAELVFLTNSHLRSVNASTGKEIWRLPFVDKLLESSTTPVKVGDMILAGSVMSGSIGVKVKDGIAEQMWKNPALTCYFSTPVAMGDYVYMVNGAATLSNPSITLRCVETKTGKVAWEKKNVGKYHAALLKTGDGKLLLHDDLGNIKLIEPDAKEYKELCTAKVCGETWAHPAIVDGKLLLRDAKELICLDVKGK